LISWTDQEHTNKDFDREDLTDIHMKNCQFIRCSFRGVRMVEMTSQGCIFVSDVKLDITQAVALARAHGAIIDL
jgi:hypothetical protein